MERYHYLLVELQDELGDTLSVWGNEKKKEQLSTSVSLGCSNVHLCNPVNSVSPCHLLSLYALFYYLANRCLYQQDFLYRYFLSSAAAALQHNGGILGHNFIQIRIKNVTSLFSTHSRNIHETPPGFWCCTLLKNFGLLCCECDPPYLTATHFADVYEDVCQSVFGFWLNHWKHNICLLMFLPLGKR